MAANLATQVANAAGQQVAGASISHHPLPTSRFHSQHGQQQEHQAISASLGKKGLQGSRLRPNFAKSLPLLEISRPSQREQSYNVHVHIFSSIVGGVVGPVQQKRDLPDQTELKNDLDNLFKLPSDTAEDIDRHPYVNLEVGARWREIHGSKDWEGILSTKDGKIDPVLRGEVIRYGEFAQATYDAFDNDSDSKFCGNAKFSKEKLLEEVGLLNRGYEIVEFLYATADAHVPKFFRKSSVPDEEKWSKDSNFMGFVAVCTSPRELARLGRRDIVVAWRGTVTKLEWLANVRDYFSPTGLDPRRSSAIVAEKPFLDDIHKFGDMVESGLLDARKSKEVESLCCTKLSAGEQVLGLVRNLAQKWMEFQGKTEVMVESGFLDVYKAKNECSRYNKLSAREQVLTAVRDLVQKYKDEEVSITVTGHSLGSALATLCAYDIAESGINKRDHSPKVPKHWNHPDLDQAEQHPDHHTEPMENRVPVSVISFAGPRVGNSDFKERIEQLGVTVLRVVEEHDLVPRVPGVIFNEKLEFVHNLWRWLPDSYVHVGKELKLNSLVSDYLRDTTDPLNAHNLEAYLHLLDGWQGNGGDFCPIVNRDIALVNKASDFLEPRLGIPENWWEKKLMSLDKETKRWVLATMKTVKMI